MVISDLALDVHTFSLLSKVNKQILDWNLEPLTGKGLYSKHHSVAYLEIKMYASRLGAYPDKNIVIWDIPEDQIIDVHPHYKADIERSLTFFLRYIAALRGEVINLSFEINDAGFDKTSARFSPFEKAAIYAIINSFDPNAMSFMPKRIQTLKANGK